MTPNFNPRIAQLHPLTNARFLRSLARSLAKRTGDEYGYDYGQPSENITIRDCAISTPCAAVAVGSEMSGGVSNVSVSRLRLWDSTAGVHIKSGPGRGGYVRGRCVRACVRACVYVLQYVHNCCCRRTN